jgi:cell division protease FtsH
MSSRLGPRTFGRREELIFLGRDIAEQRNYSEAVAESIDHEVSQLIDDAYRRAQDILHRNVPLLEKIADQLIEVETLDAETFEAIVDEHQGKTPKPAPDPVVEDRAEPEEPAADANSQPEPAPKQRPAEGAVG